VKPHPLHGFAAEQRDGALTAPLVIQAHGAITGHVFFRAIACAMDRSSLSTLMSGLQRAPCELDRKSRPSP